MRELARIVSETVDKYYLSAETVGGIQVFFLFYFIIFNNDFTFLGALYDRL